MRFRFIVDRLLVDIFFRGYFADSSSTFYIVLYFVNALAVVLYVTVLISSDKGIEIKSGIFKFYKYSSKGDGSN